MSEWQAPKLRTVQRPADYDMPAQLQAEAHGRLMSPDKRAAGADDDMPNSSFARAKLRAAPKPVDFDISAQNLPSVAAKRKAVETGTFDMSQVKLRPAGRHAM